MIRILISLTLIGAIFSQTQARADDDSQVWLMTTATYALSSEHRLSLEVQPRWDIRSEYVERFLLRGAYGYLLKPGVSLWFGYLWAPVYLRADGTKDFINENRLWQQLSVEHSYEQFRFSNRLRLEQRLIDDQPQVSNRARHQLRVSHPVLEFAGYSVGAFASNEIFVTLHGMHRGPIGGFDRSRYFVGPYVQRGDTRVDMGYLGEYSRLRGGESRQIDAFMLALNFQLPG